MQILQNASLCDLDRQIRLIFSDYSLVTSDFVQNLRCNLLNPQDEMQSRAISQLLFNLSPTDIFSLKMVIKLLEACGDNVFETIPVTHHLVPKQQQRNLLLAVVYAYKAPVEESVEEACNSFEKAIELAQVSYELYKLLPFFHYNYAEYCLHHLNYKLALRNYKLAAYRSRYGEQVNLLAKNGQHRICEVAYRARIGIAPAVAQGFRRTRQAAQQIAALSDDKLLEQKIADKVREIRKSRMASQGELRCVSVQRIGRVGTRKAGFRSLSAQNNGHEAKTQPPSVLGGGSAKSYRSGVFYQRKNAPPLKREPAAQQPPNQANQTDILNAGAQGVRNDSVNLTGSPTFCYNTRLNEYDDNFYHAKCEPLPPARMLWVYDDVSIIGRKTFGVFDGWKRAVDQKNGSQPLRFEAVYEDLK